MQMPGGHQGNSLSGYGTIGYGTSAERRSRKVSKTSSSDPRVGADPTPHNVMHRSEVVRSSSADGLDSGRLPTNGNTDVVDETSPTSRKRSRSRIGKWIVSFNKSFSRPHKHSSTPTTSTSFPEQTTNPPAPNTQKLSPAVIDSLDRLKIRGETLMKPVRPLTTRTWDNFQFANGRSPGVMGLGNHGNTCFMNAILQCLSNTEHFAEYFVTDQCQSDIRAAQLAGRSCSVTQHFAKLITSLWTCEYRSNISIAFKWRVGERASQYSGEEQNDAQEFLQWLLDQINEELYGSSISNVNGQIKKFQGVGESTTGSTSTNGCPKMNIVHDLFLAQFRSTITCPHCGEHSCKLDPFLLVPLPISERYKIPVYTTVVRSHPTPSLVRIAAMLSTADSIIDVRHSIAARTTISPIQLVLLQVSNDIGFVRNFRDQELLSDSEDGIVSLFAIQIITITSAVPIIAIIAVNIYVTDRDSRKFGYPFVFHASRDLPAHEFRMLLLNSMKDLLRESATTQMESVISMFRLRLFREEVDGCDIADDIELPLYMTEIDDALSDCDASDGPPHIKLTLEWDYNVYKRWILPGNRRVTPIEDVTVKQVKSESQHLSAATLDDCFRDFTQKERLGVNDKWYCPKCKRHRSKAIKSMSLSSLPDIMVVQLKRFKQESEENRAKLNALIQFPLEGLDMRRHLETAAGDESFTESSDCIYDLYAVCNHIGNLQGGHYTAFCRNPVNGQWYKFDDEKVTSLRSDSAVVTKAAYLLYYRRRAARSRCDVDLRQWISAVCTASGPASNPVPANHQPGYGYDQPNAFRRSSVTHRSGRSQFYVTPPQPSGQFPSGSLRSTRTTSRSVGPIAPGISAAARKAIINQNMRKLSTSSSYHNSLSQSPRPGAGSYGIPKSVSDGRVSSKNPLIYATRDYETRQNHSQYRRASQQQSPSTDGRGGADVPLNNKLTDRVQRGPVSNTLRDNCDNVVASAAANRTVVSESTRSNVTTVLDKSLNDTAVTSDESYSDESDVESKSSSPVVSPARRQTAPSVALGSGNRLATPSRMVFEKVNGSTTTSVPKTVPVHESSV